MLDPTLLTQFQCFACPTSLAFQGECDRQWQCDRRIDRKAYFFHFFIEALLLLCPSMLIFF